MPEPQKSDASQEEPTSPVPLLPKEDTKSPEEKEQAEGMPVGASDYTPKADTSNNDEEQTAAISQNPEDSVKTDTESTPNGKVSTSDMQETCNNGDNCELESDDALKSNGDVLSHQQAECEDGQEITKM